MSNGNWIRPDVAVQPAIPSADREITHNGVRYAVARARVVAMAHTAADPIPGELVQRDIPGPFQVGPMCVGKLYEQTDNHIDADWYFEIF